MDPMKEKYIAVVDEDQNGGELISTAMEAYKVLKGALKSFCVVYDVSLQVQLDIVG